MNFDLFFYQTAACLTFIVKEKKDTCKHETNFQTALLKMSAVGALQSAIHTVTRILQPKSLVRKHSRNTATKTLHLKTTMLNLPAGTL